MEKQITEILAKLTDHEKRLSQLEGKGSVASQTKDKKGVEKQKTLREIVKGKKFKNGQEQIAAIVGYHEQIIGQCIKKDEIKNEWKDAKMENKFSAEFISRAKDTLIRIHSDETCDLTQTGENFFDELLSGGE